MSDAGRAALRQALATAGTALVVGSLHVPQPFLAVLAAQLVGGFCCNSLREFLRRLAAAWSGTLAGLFLLVTVPDQQWLSLPLFCIATGFGITCACRRMGPGSAVLFAMGIGGMFSAGIVFPGAGLMSGLAHASSLSIAAIVSAAAWKVCMRPECSVDPGTSPVNPWIIGLAATGSLILACLTLPTEGVVMTIATMTTVLALETSAKTPEIGERSLGALLGVAVSVAFLSIVSGAGNNLAVFLGALAFVMGGFEWLASTFSDKAFLFRQAAALFAVAATMLPRPEQFLTASIGRMLAVILGFLAAIAIFAITAPRALRVDLADQPREV